MKTDSKYIQVVVLAVIEQDGHYLFTLRNDPQSSFHQAWQLPGGGLEYGEKPHEALEREVREELGLVLSTHRLIPYIHSEARGNWQGVFLSFHCSISQNQTIVLNDEATEYIWQPVNQTAQLNPMPGCLAVISALQKMAIFA